VPVAVAVIVSVATGARGVEWDRPECAGLEGGERLANGGVLGLKHLNR
jgi:hypothetical protein